ncbi:SRPBCC family protein [Streptomyces sp. NPDC002285]
MMPNPTRASNTTSKISTLMASQLARAPIWFRLKVVSGHRTIMCILGNRAIIILIKDGWSRAMKRIENSVVIGISAETVWDLTLDVERWPSFLSTVQHVQIVGPKPLMVGGAVRVKQPGQPLATWKVTRIFPGIDFTWATKRMGMTITASHVLKDLNGTCLNTLTIDLEGPGSGMFAAVFGRMIKKNIAAENACFKLEAERRS